MASIQESVGETSSQSVVVAVDRYLESHLVLGKTWLEVTDHPHIICRLSGTSVLEAYF